VTPRGLQFHPIGAGDEVDALLKEQIHAAQEGVRRGGRPVSAEFGHGFYLREGCPTGAWVSVRELHQ